MLEKNPTDSFSVVISRDFLINYSLANEPLEHQLSGNILRKMNLRLYAHFLRNKNWAMCTTNPINYFLHSWACFSVGILFSIWKQILSADKENACKIYSNTNHSNL